MKSTLGWILAIVLGLILLLVLPGLWMMGRFGVGGYGGMMGGQGMMGGYNGMHSIGWGWMVLAWLIPAGVIVLLVVGVVALVNGLNKTRSTTLPLAVSGRTCPNCSKPALADWTTCPYCGQKLS